MAVTNGPNIGVIEDSPAGEIAPNDWRKMLRALDAFLFFSVLSMTTTAQPGSPANGARYIIPAGATGTDWAGKAAGTIAIYTTRYTITTGGTESTIAAWEFYTPKIGWRVFDQATGTLALFNGTSWVQGAAVADATDAASVITQLNLLLARCRASGIIAT